MGLLNVLFGGSSSKPRVTEKEYREIKLKLHNLDFSEYERNKVDELFAPDFNMPVTDSHPKGLEKGEVEARIKWLHENKSKHSFSDHRIDQIEAAFLEKL